MLKWHRGMVVVAALVGLFTLSGCIELTGQRLVWRHDAEADTLTFLLFYDGVHDRTDDPQRMRTAQQEVAEFVQKGDVMLLDWFGRLELVKMRSRLANEEAREPGAAQMREALRLIRTAPIGHYLESDRTGAAQIVTITSARRFVTLVNQYINARVLAADLPEGDETSAPVRTALLRRAAAERGHAWLALDGQAITLSLPFDSQDWGMMKADILYQFVVGPADEEQATTMAEQWRMLVQVLATSPISITDKPGMVVVTLGRIEEPTAAVVRVPIRETYHHNLQTAVRAAVADDLHQKVVAGLKDPRDADEGVRALIAFGPPEVVMLALAEAVAAGDDAAVPLLRDRARAWNTANRRPTIPNAASDHPATLVAGVRQWYGLMKSYPFTKDNFPELPRLAPAAPAEEAWPAQEVDPQPNWPDQMHDAVEDVD